MATMKERQIEIMDYVEADIVKKIDYYLRQINVNELAAIQMLYKDAKIDLDEACSLIREWEKPIVQKHTDALSTAIGNLRGA